MIKALIKERTIDTGPFDAIHWLIFDFEEDSGVVHVQSVIDAVVPMDGKELVGRTPGERLLMKDTVDCYTFLTMMGVYNKDEKLEDIRDMVEYTDRTDMDVHYREVDKND